MNIYQDESGCLGFKDGSSKYFVVALLSTDRSKHLGNVIRKLKGQIIKAGWPKDRYQLLCSNCNQGKRRNGGICPHKTKNQ